MKITLTRVDTTDHGIFGRMTFDGSEFSCTTLERHDICIPQGTYPIVMYNSPEHGIVPLLQGVPGRSMIEIHEGNWEENSKGCILVGAKRAVVEGKEGIATSKDTLKKVVELIQQNPANVSISIV